jgi:hypothetical protein
MAVEPPYPPLWGGKIKDYAKDRRERIAVIFS